MIKDTLIKPWFILGLFLMFGSVHAAAGDSLGDATVHVLNKSVVTAQNEVSAQKELYGKAWLARQKGSLAESLEDEAGIHKRSLGPAPARPIYHGLGGDHIQIAEDMGKVSDLSATSPDHAVGMNAAHIRSLQLISGAELLAYSLSVSGLRIETDRGLFMTDPREAFNTRTLLATQSATPGGFGSIQLELPMQPLSLRLQSAALGQADVHSPKASLNNTDAHAFDGATSAQLDFKNSRYGISYEQYTAEYGIPGGFMGSHKNGVRIEMNRRSLKSGVAYRLGQDSLRLNMAGHEFHQIEAEVKGRVGAEFGINEYHLQSAYHHPIHNTLKWHSGLDLGFERREYGGIVFTPFTERLRTGFWSMLKQGAKNQWQTTTGFRLEQSQDQLSGFYASRDSKKLPEREITAYSLYIQTEKSMALKAGQAKPILGLYRTSRIPTVEELYNQGPHLAAYSYDQGNPDVKVESGYGSDLRWLFELKSFKINTGLYFTYYPAYISTRPTGLVHWATGLPEYRAQSNQAALGGGDLLLSYLLKPYLRVKSLWDYTHGEDLTRKEPLSAIAPLRSQSTLMLFNQSHEWSLTLVWLMAQNRVSKFENTTPGSVVFNSDYMYSKPIPHGVVRMNLGVENLLNSTWKNHLSRIRQIFPEPGLNLYAKVLLEL
jgi:iron complex outermembrane receptor protein